MAGGEDLDKVRMPVTGQETVAIGEMQVSEARISLANRPGDAPFLDIHVEQVAKHHDSPRVIRWAAFGSGESQFLGIAQGSEIPRLVAVERFEENGGGAIRVLLQRVLQGGDAPLLRY